MSQNAGGETGGTPVPLRSQPATGMISTASFASERQREYIHMSATDINAFIDQLLARTGRESAATIPILQGIQREYRYLPEPALRRVSEVTGIRLADLVGVATFYHQFRLQPVGRHTLRVCHGTACHVKGSENIQDAINRALRIPAGADTSPNNEFTVERVACLGCCTLAPVVAIEEATYGHLTADTIGAMLADFRATRHTKGADVDTVAMDHNRHRSEIRVGLGSCCMAKGSDELFHRLRTTVDDLGLDVSVKRVGCVGMCHQTPMVEIRLPSGPTAFYAKVEPAQAEHIVRQHFKPASLGRRIVRWADRRLEEMISRDPRPAHMLDVHGQPVEAFMQRQVRIATEGFGEMDPLDLDEYLARGGFQALTKALTIPPEEIIAEITASGLRGRGGAGFPTGVKWSRVRSVANELKYIIVNGDEGDPGAFMDRMLMESFPYRIIEGVLIAARAVGATEGYIYVRAEYPRAVSRLRTAIHELESRGFLGGPRSTVAVSPASTDAILRGSEQVLKVPMADGAKPDGHSRPTIAKEPGCRAGMPNGLPAESSDFQNTFSVQAPLVPPNGFRLHIFEGAGAFVCGEETALLESIEGKRGIPRIRPPFPAERGLWGRPTLVNNVETFAFVPWILRHGAAAFAAFGTARSKGTKVFALAGEVARAGLIEVPMGITIGEIVEEIGGGIPSGKRFKAVQIGGPSGGCLPATLASTPVDYEALAAAGAIMGSGGLIVLDETTCMVDMARFFMSFLKTESCGECTFCRIGTQRMFEILDRLCAGRGKPGDLAELEQLAGLTTSGSLCGLGRTAPNPVLTTLRYFRDEYEAHIAGRCPAGRCKALIRYVVQDNCTGCTICAQHCPASAIPLTPYRRHQINVELCTGCDVCRTDCPENAITIESGGQTCT